MRVGSGRSILLEKSLFSAIRVDVWGHSRLTPGLPRHRKCRRRTPRETHGRLRSAGECDASGSQFLLYVRHLLNIGSTSKKFDKLKGMPMAKTGLVVSAHPGDFVWRAGGAIALHVRKGYRVKIVCLAFGERGESQFAWKQSGTTLEKVKAGRKDEAERAAAALGAEIEFFDAGDYPLRLTDAHMERLIDIYREINPSFVLTHSLEDPYNVDHPAAAAYAQEARIVAQAMGHKPQAEYSYAAPPVFLFEPHQPEMCNFKPQVILNIDEVWDLKRKTFEILAAQKHLWAYYERVALQRGMQGGRNSGKAMTYGEAYQRLFPMAVEELA
jgi:4-oxalomesaconate hydratase